MARKSESRKKRPSREPLRQLYSAEQRFFGHRSRRAHENTCVFIIFFFSIEYVIRPYRDYVGLYLSVCETPRRVCYQSPRPAFSLVFCQHAAALSLLAHLCLSLSLSPFLCFSNNKRSRELPLYMRLLKRERIPLIVAAGQTMPGHTLVFNKSHFTASRSARR